MASKLSYDIGYYSFDEINKLMTLFNGDKGRNGITVTADVNVPDWNNILLTIESDKFNSKLEMVDMFANILAVELLDRL